MNSIEADYGQLKKVIDCADSGIHLVNHDGITIYYNESAEKIDGMRKEDIIGKNIRELVEDGTFSKSVALEVLETNKNKEIYQLVNNKYVFARGIPIFKKNFLDFVVVYTRDLDSMRQLNKQLNQIKKENERLTKDLKAYESKYSIGNYIVHNNKQMDRIVKLGKRVAKLDSSVLITGEPGTGKTLFANYIHDNSNKEDIDFIKFDCSAIPNSILESELFGMELLDSNGNILEYCEGLLQSADGGTIFIDEIADMPISSQSKLLEVLEDGIYSPKASNRKIKINVRIIAASNENLLSLIEKGKFREDLYYRLNVIPIHIPPLRNRKEDIMSLVKIFMNKFNNYYGINKEISFKARKAFLNYHWPGNVRELENLLERLVITTEGIIEYEDVIEYLDESKVNYSEASSYKEKVDEYEKSLILYYSNISESIKDMSEKAQINESTLRKKIDRYGLKIDF